MIARITGNNNPDFFFLTYSSVKQKVNDLIFIPKHFFVPEMIEKRKPLAETARRAGWVGCNILIEKIPEQGRVSIIADGEITEKNSVLSKVSRSNNLEVTNINSRGWLMSILNCVNRIPDTVFTLKEMYQFEDELKLIYPENNNIQAKIRDASISLRDKEASLYLRFHLQLYALFSKMCLGYSLGTNSGKVFCSKHSLSLMILSSPNASSPISQQLPAARAHLG